MKRSDCFSINQNVRRRELKRVMKTKCLGKPKFQENLKHYFTREPSRNIGNDHDLALQQQQFLE